MPGYATREAHNIQGSAICGCICVYYVNWNRHTQPSFSSIYNYLVLEYTEILLSPWSSIYIKAKTVCVCFDFILPCKHQRRNHCLSSRGWSRSDRSIGRQPSATPRTRRSSDGFFAAAAAVLAWWSSATEPASRPSYHVIQLTDSFVPVEVWRSLAPPLQRQCLVQILTRTFFLLFLFWTYG